MVAIGRSIGSNRFDSNPIGIDAASTVPIEEQYEALNWCAPGLAEPVDHDLFAVPEDPNCEICHDTRMIEAAARRH